MKLASGYDKKAKKETAEYRHLTLEECKSLRSGQHVQFIDRYGEVRNAKVNGAPKTWKTRPGDCDVPLKYGMYEYFYARFRNGESTAEELVIPA